MHPEGDKTQSEKENEFDNVSNFSNFLLFKYITPPLGPGTYCGREGQNVRCEARAKEVCHSLYSTETASVKANHCKILIITS